MTTCEDLVLTDQHDRATHLTVTGLDRLAFEQLVERHPPREDEGTLWNDRTFPAALIEACTDLTLASAERFWDEAEVDDAEDVFETCLRLSGPGQWTWATWRLKRDPRLRIELRLCNKLAISHSHFLGGPPLWNDRDRDLAIAAMEIEYDRCPGCAVPRELMQNPDGAEIEQESCVHCELLAQMRAAIPDGERERIHLTVVPVQV